MNRSPINNSLLRPVRILTFFFLLGGVLLTAAAPPPQSVPPTPLPPIHSPLSPLPSPRFGVIESYQNPAAAAELGAGWTRVTFQWAEAQAAGPNAWTPAVSMAQIDAEIAAGREVVGLLIGIPEWARDENRLPRGLWLPPDDPENTWAVFVREVVDRYRGRISHWIIWNEPDIAADAIAHTWDGDVADFAQLQRVAYRVAKETNPRVVIHLAAFTYWADVYRGTEQYMARLLDELAADPAAPAHNYYFDVAAAHLYFQPSQIYDLLTAFTDIMRERGLDHPIWLVETNAPPSDDPAWPVAEPHLLVTLPEQAAFMPQALGVALAAGAERAAVYKLQDTEDDRAANPEPFGLVRMNGERRPAFETYQAAIRLLAGVQEGERLRWDGIAHLRFRQPDRTTSLVFNRLFFEQEIAVPSEGGTAEGVTALLIDQWGADQTITSTNGVYTVTLPAAPCSHPIGDYCMIGGPVFYLVQGTNGALPPAGPVPTLTPPPRPTATASPTTTATSAPAVTSSPAATPTPTATPISATTAAPTPSPSLTAAAREITVVPPVPERTARGNAPLFLLLFLLSALALASWKWRRR